MIDFRVGDCLEILSGMPSKMFDVCMTSPPYNLGIKYRSGFDDSMPRSDYLCWTRHWLIAVQRVLAPQGSLFLNLGGKPSDPWGPFEVASDCVRQSGFTIQNVFAWVKSASWDGVGPVEGHVKPINSPRFVTDCFEHVFHLTKTGDVPLDRLAVGVPFADESNLTRGTRGKNGNVRCRGNVVVVPYETINSREKDRPHPASYPPALSEYFLRLHGLSRIRSTLDPFSGLGSTARACRKLGLDHVGIDLSAEDVADARRLLAEDEAQAAALLEKLGRVVT